jgi:hypothetical protein
MTVGVKDEEKGSQLLRPEHPVGGLNVIEQPAHDPAALQVRRLCAAGGELEVHVGQAGAPGKTDVAMEPEDPHQSLGFPVGNALHQLRRD